MQKNPGNKDLIKYPGKVEIINSEKGVKKVLPNTEKIIEKKNQKIAAKGKNNFGKNEFKDISDQKTAEQTLESYSTMYDNVEMKVKKMIETKMDPRLNIQFDKMVRK